MTSLYFSIHLCCYSSLSLHSHFYSFCFSICFFIHLVIHVLNHYHIFNSSIHSTNINFSYCLCSFTYFTSNLTILNLHLPFTDVSYPPWLNLPLVSSCQQGHKFLYLSSCCSALHHPCHHHSLHLTPQHMSKNPHLLPCPLSFPHHHYTRLRERNVPSYPIYRSTVINFR